MSTSPDDAEINVVLNMLAEESSDLTHAETMAITVGQELDKTVETRKPEGTRPKSSRQVSRSTMLKLIPMGMTMHQLLSV
jgi:hypothetical protein